MKTLLKRREFLIVFTILTISSGFFVWKNNVVAKTPSVIINEIMYDLQGTDSRREWIEIFNPSGVAVDLSNWKFFEAGVNHSLKLKQGHSFLASQEYAVIADNANVFLEEHIEYQSTIFDSSFSLSNSGETIALKNGAGEIVFETNYSKEQGASGNGFTLERENNNLWRESYVLGGTPGAKNSQKPEPIVYSSEIRINELLPNPEEKPEKKYEYTELYNYGSEEIDLSGWELKDKTGSFKLSEVIQPKEYKVFYDTVSLNNSGDEIKLVNPSGKIVYQISYGKAKENYAYGFNGEDWEWTPFLTPGKANQFKVKKIYAHSVRINEILPNPSGDEKLNEYIELYNFGNQLVDLSQWILKDSSKRGKFIFPENVLIKAKNFLAIYRSDFKFAMNNSGSETVYLLDPNERIASFISYSKAKEDVSYNFSKLGWRWSRFLTPGKENKFNQLPRIEIKRDKKIYKNVYADFKVKINDPDKDKIRVTWDFGDGHKSYKKKTRHKYKKKGNYSASLKVFDGSEEIIKKFKVKVKKFPRPKVRIVRLLPNPKGKDSELEWIEIKNKSSKEINLKNWSIATGRSSKKLINHPIREDFFIGSGKAEKITRDLSKFSLNNKKCRVELRYPDGKAAYKVKYKKEGGAKDNEIYGKIKGGKWKWTRDVENVEIVEDVEVVEDVEDDEVVEDEKYIGGQSVELSDDKKIELLIGELDIEALENTVAVLGAATVKKIDNGYVFNSPAVSDEHYASVFFKKLFQKINQALNNWLNLLN